MAPGLGLGDEEVDGVEEHVPGGGGAQEEGRPRPPVVLRVQQEVGAGAPPSRAQGEGESLTLPGGGSAVENKFDEECEKKRAAERLKGLQMDNGALQ